MESPVNQKTNMCVYVCVCVTRVAGGLRDITHVVDLQRVHGNLFGPVVDEVELAALVEGAPQLRFPFGRIRLVHAFLILPRLHGPGLDTHTHTHTRVRSVPSRTRCTPGLGISFTHLKDGVLLLLLRRVARGVFPGDLEAFALAVQPHQTGKRPVIHLRHQPGFQPHAPRMRRHHGLLEMRKSASVRLRITKLSLQTLTTLIKQFTMFLLLIHFIMLIIY